MKLENGNANIWIKAIDLELLRPINYSNCLKEFILKKAFAWLDNKKSFKNGHQKYCERYFKYVERVSTKSDVSYLSLNDRAVLKFIAYYKTTAPLKSRKLKDKKGNALKQLRISHTTVATLIREFFRQHPNASLAVVSGDAQHEYCIFIKRPTNGNYNIVGFNCNQGEKIGRTSKLIPLISRRIEVIPIISTYDETNKDGTYVKRNWKMVHQFITGQIDPWTSPPFLYYYIKNGKHIHAHVPGLEDPVE